MAFTHIGLVNMVISMRSAGHSWNYIRNKIAPDVSKIVFWKIANKSYEPKDPLLRYKLGLPEIQLLTICPDCRKPKTRNHQCGIKRNRLSINLDDPFSAGMSIERHMDKDKIIKLMEYLERWILK